MKKYCPYCSTEMLEHCNVFVCPRNNIGECTYDGYEVCRLHAETHNLKERHNHTFNGGEYSERN
ncbi:hypothetical protein LRP52_46625 [Photobacterium sp. ZSDE20]|uniref:Uncharacterized protein n=1 Tax=Photobacterium pectinilyticum TaxID=2906793 RepID=A0ABT1NAR7_9GAMM|nr:hypothetical protein [Photobacterium sp. ZSDE20]MCQ1061227.1 hypothetical protein [Photobacterium sp. ZSDE20]MDD1829630.1 hypothetical protein [Photobacterium sp. ZSDE20]